MLSYQRIALGPPSAASDSCALLGRRRCQAREAAAQKGPGEQPEGPSCSSGCTRHPVGRLRAVWKRLGSEPFQEGHDLSSVLFQNNETYLTAKALSQELPGLCSQPAAGRAQSPPRCLCRGRRSGGRLMPSPDRTRLLLMDLCAGFVPTKPQGETVWSLRSQKGEDLNPKILL